MIGRLGMTGASLTRGDSAIYKAMSANEAKAAAGRAASMARGGDSKATQAAAQKAKAKAAKIAARTAARTGGQAPSLGTATLGSPVQEAPKKASGKLLRPTGSQYGRWGVDAALVGAGGTALAHRSVKKADTRKRNTAAGAVVGAGGTDLALNVGGWATRESIKRHEAKADAGVRSHKIPVKDPVSGKTSMVQTSRKQRGNILRDHNHAHGITDGNVKGAGNAYYRSYPSTLPAWKRKRMMGIKNNPVAVAGMLTAGTVAGAAVAARKKTDVAKASARSKHDYSGAAVGSGAVVGTVGLAAGGIPGVKSNKIMVDVKGAKSVKAKAKGLVGAYRGGEFGYRHNAHHTFKTFGLGGEAPKQASRVEHFSDGVRQGKIQAEDKIIRHLKVGRTASNVALVGGTALVGAGVHQRKKQVAKRDDFKADVGTAVGATTALTAGGVSRVLDHQGRKWSKESAASHDAARTLNPRLGGYDVKTTKTNVPDVVPHRSKMKNVVQHKTVFAGRSNKSTEAAGTLKGAAGQQRYFAATYGGAAKLARKVRTGGALVATAGVGAKGINAARNKQVAKAETTMSDEHAKVLADKYDTRGPLPKTLNRETKMKAYEARYIAAGGKKGERWKRKAAGAEAVRSTGLAGATISAAGILGHRGKKTGKILAKIPHLTSRNLEGAGLAAAAGGGAGEMYGAYARHRRASYANSPAGVAGSALTRMQNYTKRPKT